MQMKSLQCPRRRVRIEVSNQYQSVAHLREQSGQCQAPRQGMGARRQVQNRFGLCHYAARAISCLRDPSSESRDKRGYLCKFGYDSLAMTLQTLGVLGLRSDVLPQNREAHPTALASLP